MTDGSRVTFQRARSAQQKQQRRASILQAARELALTDSVRNVTLAMIADRVGLAPSNVLANYGPREEIYLDLLVETWTDWTDALERALIGPALDSAEVSKVVSDTLVAQPLFCDLVAYISPSYEYTVSVEAVRRITATGRESSMRFRALFRALFSFTEEQLFDLEGATNACIGWWWMRSHPSANVVRGQHLVVDVTYEFGPGVQRWVKTYIDGLLAQSREPTGHSPS